jgi:hypothetical protein
MKISPLLAQKLVLAALQGGAIQLLGPDEATALDDNANAEMDAEYLKALLQHLMNQPKK